MARLFQSVRRFLGLDPSKPTRRVNPRSRNLDFSVFREGDRVVIHGKHNPSLSKPLQKGNKTDTRRGVLEHDTIIDGRVWNAYRAHKGPEYRLSLPSLEEYIALTPRLVTPIYGADASLIVSLLDIHVAPPPAATEANNPETRSHQPLEILESGTGHGSLTLHLARAIQAANSTPPRVPDKSQVRYVQNRPLRPDEEKPKAGEQSDASRDSKDEQEDQAQQQQQQEWDDWRASRNAIIHTIDVSPKYSHHAEKIVRGFRQGIYAGNVDFYVGSVESWISEQVQQRRISPPSSSTSGASGGILSRVKDTITQQKQQEQAFLSYAILDMPSAHHRIPLVAPILKRNGLLVVFMPSITQIGDCLELIRRQRLPFVQERVVELGAGLTGGRLWDVRFAVKKSRADPASWSSSSAPVSEEETETPQQEEDSSPDTTPTPTPSPTPSSTQEEDSVLVCRPKVGTRIVGGGFVGIWRRIEDRDGDGV